MPVHVVVAQTDTAGEAIVELLPLEQQAKQDREERLMDPAQANKDMIRNMAHDIKNPLGGIPGAAQRLPMDSGKELTESPKVLLHRPDRTHTPLGRLRRPPHHPPRPGGLRGGPLPARGLGRGRPPPAASTAEPPAQTHPAPTPP